MRFASESGNLEIVKFLIEKGANKTVISPDHTKTLRYLALLDKMKNKKAIIIQRWYRKLNY